MRHCQVFYVENSSHCCTIECLGWTNDTGVYFYLLSRISRDPQIAENRHPLTFSKLKLEEGGGCSADETSAQWRMQILGRHNRNKRVQRKRAVPIPGIQPTETSSKQILVSELDRLWVRWPRRENIQCFWERQEEGDSFRRDRMNLLPDDLFPVRNVKWWSGVIIGRKSDEKWINQTDMAGID